MSKIKDSKICVVCGIYCKSFLCNKHRGRYIYYPKHKFVALKPRRKISKAQTKLFKLVREKVSEPCFQEVIFPFNIFYRYDIVVPSMKLIVEYDGRQHFKYVKFFHKTKANFKRRQKIDEEKALIAENEGWDMLRINYKDKESSIKKKITWKLKKVK